MSTLARHRPPARRPRRRLLPRLHRLLPRTLIRKPMAAALLRPGDYVHTTIGGYRILSVTHRPDTVGVEAALDSGTPMFVTHPSGRPLDVTRTRCGLARLLPERYL